MRLWPAEFPARRPGLLSLILMGMPFVMLAACGDDGGPRVPPYVLQQGCQFTLEVGGGNSTSTTIEKGNTLLTYSLSMGGQRVDVSDCRVVDNPGELPIYRE